MVAHVWNLFSNKHYLVQFLAKLWASTANIKGMGVLQTHNNHLIIVRYSMKTLH